MFKLSLRRKVKPRPHHPRIGGEALQSASPSSALREDELGLTVIHGPETPPTADIIFVHGLGGTRRLTWTKDRDPTLFWPEWLKQEPVIQTARVWSFGYNSSYDLPGTAPITGVSDFASSLLYGMKFAGLGIGEKPIVFIAHSLGGLVFKKAYILGHNDDEYKDIVAAIDAVLFLATPHRGSNYAEVLQRVLSASVVYSPKQYVGELKVGSPMLVDINEQFKHFTTKLKLFSYYETLPTPITGLAPFIKIIVVEKESSVLGYPEETSKPLNSHHRNACKYNSREDPNYIDIRDALKYLISKYQRAEMKLLDAGGREHIKKLSRCLALPDKLDEEFTFFLEQWKQGTCEWIISDQSFQNWHQNQDSALLWLSAPPGSGKSVLSAYIVNHLKDSVAFCQYHFFRFDTQDKRSVSSCLRALALQVAEQVPAFRKALNRHFETGSKLQKADARTVWHKLFVNLLFNLELPYALFWVFDALDESDSAGLLINLMESVESSQTPIKVLLVSRPTREISSAFARYGQPVPTISAVNEQDIQLYIEDAIANRFGSPQVEVEITKRLLSKAQGNFLWVHLVLNEVVNCITTEEIDSTLRTLPEDMNKLYEQMERRIESKPIYRDSARIILTWAACSRRPLKLDEFEEAIRVDVKGFFNIHDMLNKICGQFVHLDAESRLVMVHETACSYLTNSSTTFLAIDTKEAHQTLFFKCISILSNTQRRRSSAEGQNTGRIERHPFLRYAATSWPYHLKLSSTDSENSLISLVSFFKSQNVLLWISELAQLRLLKWLAEASKEISSFVRRKRRSDAERNPLLHKLTDLAFLESWSTDLIKVLGKFGDSLLLDPSSIFRLIPPFCPTTSAIFLQYRQSQSFESEVRISGLKNLTWDDSLAKVSVGSHTVACQILPCGKYIAILTSAGLIVVYMAETFEEYYTFQHNEYVSAFCFNNSGDQLASYGFFTTKIWAISEKRLLHTIHNATDSRALKMLFSPDDDKVIIGSNDRSVRMLDIGEKKLDWKNLDILQNNPRRGLDHNVPTFPSCIAFTEDASYIALGYRGFELEVWCIDFPEFINHCRRPNGKSDQKSSAVKRITWHEQSREVLGIYWDGAVFRWHPQNNTHHESSANAVELACSPDGRFFATGDAEGKVKLYNFDHFALIYQLSNQDPINSIAFSPDGLRLYDLRGPMCNVWEPNALLRLTELDEQEFEARSDMGSTTAVTCLSEASADIGYSITALVAQSRGHKYIIGDENGTVSIFDRPGKPIELWKSSHQTTTDHLDWSSDGKYVASSEVGGRIIVKSVEQEQKTPRGSQWIAKPMFEAKVNVKIGGIKQVLLSLDSSYLLVASRASAMVWSLPSKTNLTTLQSSDPTLSTRWINHPTDPNLLLSLNLRSVAVYRWEGLAEVGSFEIEVDKLFNLQGVTVDRPSLVKISSDFSQMSNESTNQVTRLISTPDSGYIILQYLESSQFNEHRHQTLVFSISSLMTSLQTTPRPSSLAAVFIPPHILYQIEIPLGILSNRRLVFFDSNFRLLIWMLEAEQKDAVDLQRHFFLPRDWQNKDCLALCTLRGDGALLIPMNGEVAIVEYNEYTDW